MRVDQILSGLAEGDAISQAALAMQGVFRQWNWSSELYAVKAHVSPVMQSKCRAAGEYRGGPSDVLVHHYSIGSPALDVFRAAAARKVLVYHNITPADYFRGFDDRVAAQLEVARAQLTDLADEVDAAWAVSEFNAAELRAAGFRNVRVFPLLFDPATLGGVPDPSVFRKFGAKLKTWLYVGRLAPNKKIETLIEAFYWYHKTLEPFSRLVLVGSERSCPRYFTMLRMFVGDLDLPNVCFEGFASPNGLPAYYRMADVFVTTSEHEGYCLPLVEAMHMGVPVVARAIGGMPEALNGAGVQYDGLSPNELAGLVHRVVTDSTVRQEALNSQQRRMAEIAARNVEAELKELSRDWS